MLLKFASLIAFDKFERFVLKKLVIERPPE